MARKHFSPSALPAAEAPFYIDAASVSARVWSHLIVLREETWQCLRKLHCSRLLRTSCSLQAAARKWRHLSTICSAHVALYKFLRKTLGACMMLRALYVCASGLRFPGRSRQEYTPHTTASLLELELPRTRGESSPRPRDTTSKSQFASNKIARRHMHDPRRGFTRAPQKRNKPRVFAPRPRRSVQRVARADHKSRKPSFCTLTTPIFAEGCAGTARIAKNQAFAP